MHSPRFSFLSRFICCILRCIIFASNLFYARTLCCLIQFPLLRFLFFFVHFFSVFPVAWQHCCFSGSWHATPANAPHFAPYISPSALCYGKLYAVFLFYFVLFFLLYFRTRYPWWPELCFRFPTSTRSVSVKC